MSFAVPRAVAFILPLMILPASAIGAPKVGTVTSSNDAVVAHDGKVVPASANMPLYQGDKVMTLSGGSANVQFADKSVHLGASSMTDDHQSVISMDSKPSPKGGNAKDEAAQQLAQAEHDNDGHDGHDDHGNHFGRCHMKHGHDDGDDDGGDDGDGPGHGHGHNPHCPVSP